ncbi:unnamed protein product [Closterium sp. NIES-53]
MAIVRTRCVLLFAFLTAALVAMAYAKKSAKKPVPPRPVPPTPVPPTPGTIFTILSGDKEVPKNVTKPARSPVGDPTGKAYLKLTIYKQDDQPVWLEYSVQAENMQYGVAPSIARVHNGTAGSNGPKVLDLPCKYRFSMDNNYWQCTSSLGKKTAERTGKFVSVLKAILTDPGAFYANIYTVMCPDGAVRGQIGEV